MNKSMQTKLIGTEVKNQTPQVPHGRQESAHSLSRKMEH